MEASDDAASVKKLYEAIWADDGNEVVRLLQEGADVNTVDERGSTPLMQACFGGKLSIVQSLVEAGADVNAVDDNGQMALHYAVIGAHDDAVASIAEYLLSRGSKPDAIDAHGCTPLMLAAFCEPEVIELLLAAGANPNASDHDGLTPLMHAVSEARNANHVVKRVQALLNGGTDPQIKASDGRRALDLARMQLMTVTNPEFTSVAPTIIDGAERILVDLNLEPEMDHALRECFGEVRDEIQLNHSAAIANFPVAIQILECAKPKLPF